MGGSKSRFSVSGSPIFLQSVNIQTGWIFGGLDATVDAAKSAEYMELADWIDRRYRQYGPGILYLRRLAGIIARPPAELPALSWLSPRFAHHNGVRRVQLEDPLELDVHDLRVRFHRV